MVLTVNKKILYWFFIFICIIAFLYLFLNSSEEEKKSIQVYDAYKNNRVEFPVKVMKLEKGNFIIQVKSNGIIKASREADIYSQLNAKIVKSNINEGSKVEKNEILIELEDKEYQIAFSKANDELMRSQFEYLNLRIGDDSVKRIIKKNEKLEYLKEKLNNARIKYEKGNISQDEYIQIKNEYELAVLLTGAKRDLALQSRSGMLSAINEYKRAELNLSYTKIKAPFSGYVANYELSEGSYVSTTKPICKIVDISRLKVIVSVLESDIRMISIGSSVNIVIPSMNNMMVNGKIVSISPIIDTEKKTCKVEVEIINEGLKLKPGMYANCIIDGEILKDRLFIPKKALLIRQDRKLVFVADGNKAKWCYVTTGAENDDYIEILSGLNQGDLVIIDGHYALSHNTLIKIEAEK